MTEQKTIKRLRVSVTQKEIDEATQANSNKCMIHEAIKRDHPEFRNIWVDKNQVRVTDVEQSIIYTFPMSPMGRIGLLKFDQGEPLQPFEFTLLNPVVRARRFINGAHRPEPRQQRAKSSLGAIPQQTKEGRKNTGRDRVFGQKVWPTELAKVREMLSS
jgi:hypothetical protein